MGTGEYVNKDISIYSRDNLKTISDHIQNEIGRQSEENKAAFDAIEKNLEKLEINDRQFNYYRQY